MARPARTPRRDAALPLSPREHASLKRRALAALFDPEWTTGRWEATYTRVAQEVRAALTPEERESLRLLRPYGIRRPE